MKLVEELTISKKAGSGKPKNGKKIRRKGKRTEEEQKLIDSLIKENNEIYKTAKKRGHALPEEKSRVQEIRFELISMKAI